jgi:hypothetical protein
MNTTSTINWLAVAGLLGNALYDVSTQNYSGAVAQVLAAVGLLGLHLGKAGINTDVVAPKDGK